MAKSVETVVSEPEAGASKTLRRRGPVAPVARPAQRGNTVSASIYRDLRDDIVSLRRKPGEPILEKQIAEAYGVSRTPVREAVLKLTDEGLVEVFPQSGTFVSRIPIAALPEAIAIRRVLEEATARYAAERATRSQIARLRACLEVQHECEAAGNSEGFHQADEEFHKLLSETAGYPGFWTLIQQVKVQVDRYRRLTLPAQGRMAAVLKEHEAILEAVAAHDAERAARTIGAHLDHLQGRISAAEQEHPRYFSSVGAEATR